MDFFNISIRTWDKMHGLFLFVLSVIFIVTHSLWVIILASFLSFSVLWISQKNTLNKLTPWGGYANWITLTRYVGLVFTGLFYSVYSNMEVGIILFMLIVLDGLDGYLARKLNQSTEFGAYFDMETDSLFVCIVTCILFLKGMVGIWILVPGFMRYFYMALVYVCGYTNKPEKRFKMGPYLAVLMFLSLDAAFILPRNIYLPILVVSSVLIMLSFMYSFFLLMKNAHN